MPEEKEESQEEFGWENLTAHDDGSRDMDMGGDPPPEPEPKPEAATQEQPAGTPTEAAPEPEPTPVAAPTEQAAETPEGKTEETPPADPVYTLPGGKKVTQAELAANPELLQNLVTQSNQYTDAQRLAEERKLKLAEVEADRRRLLDQYTEWEMNQRLAAEQPAPAAPLQRPDTKVLEGIYGPHLDKLVTDGRLSTDQRAEFGNVMSEYMYDQQNNHNLITAIATDGARRLDALESRLSGEVVPDLQRRQQQDAVSMDQTVQQNVATRPGYEALANPEEWNRLKLFISEKVNASPRDYEGRPTFDPMFDGDSMAQMYDALTGADTRAMLVALKAKQAEADKLTTAMAGGETAAKAGTPPIKQPSKMTPEQEAMDFRDPSMATG